MIYYQDPSVVLYQGDIREVVKELSPIDMIMTSPPYYSMRFYKADDLIWDAKDGCQHEWGMSKEKLLNLQSGNPEFKRPWREGATSTITQGQFCSLCGAWRGQLGLEPSPDLYIKHLCDIFDLLPLKKTGTLFVNLDDSYSGGNHHKSGETNPGKEYYTKDTDNFGTIDKNDIGIPAKSLIGIPERFVLEMMKRGWVRRSTIIWHKPNPMPESVQDRFTNDFEYLYMFVKSQHYYFERQFENFSPTERWGGDTFKGNVDLAGRVEAAGLDRERSCYPNSLGRNKRAVWKISTQGLNTVHLKGHYASYPEALCETPIKAGCPQFICSKCGKPRVKVYKVTRPDNYNPSIVDTKYADNAVKGSGNHGTSRPISKIFEDSLNSTTELIGYSDCGCGAPFVSGVVCDPFAGTGTTLSVAKRLGRKAVGVELSPKYCQLARKRIENSPVPLGVE